MIIIQSEGCTVGGRLGKRVGGNEGLIEGSSVGVMLGTAVGSIVGRAQSVFSIYSVITGKSSLKIHAPSDLGLQHWFALFHRKAGTSVA
jgi:hypothetical protein